MSNQTIAPGLALDDRSGESQVPSTIAPWFYRLARRVVFSCLSKLKVGTVTIVEGDEHFQFGRITSGCQLEATVTIYNPRIYADLALRGTVGGGDAYGRGLWSCDDLTTLVRIFVQNRALLDGMDGGLTAVYHPLLKGIHWLNRNTKSGSRKNIAAHYDLGNEFFRLMLDETMMYSCAYFERPDATLAEASRAKNDRICRNLQLVASDHLLEIGSGWGGFAIHAASHYGCRVTTTTISRRQYDLALQRVQEAGLSDQVTVLLTDYRDLPKLGIQFDKLVSIEMIEAIGHQYYRKFFEICSRMLKPQGLALIQGITIDERFYERAKRSVDFIQRFIFPGSCIPSVSALTQASAKVGDLGLIHLEDIGTHYAPTLRAWGKNIVAKLPEIKALRYQSEFLRLWDFYLSYCEGGFLERTISTVHMLLCKPEWRPRTELPTRGIKKASDAEPRFLEETDSLFDPNRVRSRLPTGTHCLVSTNPLRNQTMTSREELAQAFHRTRSFKWDPDKGFTLVSGATSPYYVDCRALMANPSARHLVAQLAWEAIRSFDITCIGGLEIGAISIATTISDYGYTSADRREWRTFVVRKQPKGHGLGKLIEGAVQPGDRALVVDDVLTSGGSLLKVIAAARDIGIEVSHALVLVDREEQDGRARIEQEKVRLVSLLTIQDLMKAGNQR